MTAATTGAPPALVARPGLLDPATVDRLRRLAVATTFTHITADAYAVSRAERLLTSPFDLASAPLPEAAAEPALDDAAAALGGVRPVSRTFLLYEPGSWIGVHTDRRACAVNVLVLLAGGPTAVELHPARTGSDMDDLLADARAHGGLLPGGELLALTAPGDAAVFAGSAVPHQRRPAAAPLLLLSSCYGDR